MTPNDAKSHNYDMKELTDHKQKFEQNLDKIRDETKRRVERNKQLDKLSDKEYDLALAYAEGRVHKSKGK